MSARERARLSNAICVSDAPEIRRNYSLVEADRECAILGCERLSNKAKAVHKYKEAADFKMFARKSVPEIER